MHVIKNLCCAAAITILAASGAHADQWNKKTYLTFSGPVQIPGATLPAGTYLFQLADPDNARHVVMVASKDGTHVYGMFITIPNDRLQASDENLVMFGEAPAGAPQAVEAWWYPGDRTGEEFVYPKSQASAIAKANHREVLATESPVNANGSESDRIAALRGSKVGHVDENGNMKGEPANTAANTAESARKANRAESTTAAATTTAPANTVNGRDTTTTAPKSTTARANTAPKNNTVGTAGQANTTTADNNARRKNLPRTASSLELFELLSGLSLAAAFSLRRIRRSAEAR
jgi:hypothetical protein